MKHNSNISLLTLGTLGLVLGTGTVNHVGYNDENWG
jgi:hypothetical protein